MIQITFVFKNESRETSIYQPSIRNMQQFEQLFRSKFANGLFLPSDTLQITVHKLGDNLDLTQSENELLIDPQKQLFNGAIVVVTTINNNGGDLNNDTTTVKEPDTNEAQNLDLEKIMQETVHLSVNSVFEKVEAQVDLINAHCQNNGKMSVSSMNALKSLLPSKDDKFKIETNMNISSIPQPVADANQAANNTNSNSNNNEQVTPSDPHQIIDKRFVVRLRGLPWSARENEIKHFFSGEKVKEVQIIFLSDGRASGESLVEFEDLDSFQAGFQKNRHHIGHRYIEIFKSSGAEIDTIAGRTPRPPSRVPTSQHVIRLRGLPYSATEEDVHTFFEPTKVSSVYLIKDDLGRPSGEGFVEFNSEMDAVAGMTKHRHHIAHRYIELFRSSRDELLRALGLSYGVLGSTRYPQPNSKCLLMRGLPYSCTESDITKFFQEIDVTPIRIHRKADGAEAYVEFYSVSDTDKAMTKHRNYIGRRYIELFRVTYEDMARTVGLPLPSGTAMQPSFAVSSTHLPLSFAGQVPVQVQMPYAAFPAAHSNTAGASLRLPFHPGMGQVPYPVQHTNSALSNVQSSNSNNTQYVAGNHSTTNIAGATGISHYSNVNHNHQHQHQPGGYYQQTI